MRLRTLACVALLVVGLGGCSAPADDTDTTPPPGESQTAEPDASGVGAQCGGLTTEDLVGIFGVELEGPDPSTGSYDQNDATWTSTGCDWENDEADLEIDFDMSLASDFPDGTVNCIEPGGVGDVTPVEGLGNQAWWKFDDVDEVEGELRVCTDDSMVELEVDAETGTMTSDELLEKVQSALRIVVG